MKREPLGMPRGSVRGIVALMLVTTTCALFLLGRAVPGELMTLVGVAMTYYFIQRREETAAEDEAEAEEIPEAPYVPGDEPDDPVPPASF